MAAPGMVILVSHSGWELAVVRAERCSLITLQLDHTATLGTRANNLASTMQREGYRGEGVMLAIASDWCLVGTISLDGIPRQQRRQAMLFRFEEKLPLAAEDVVADFIPSKDSALAVCVEIELLQPLVDALEAAGIRVSHISPAALLAIQRRISASPDSAIVREGAGAIEVFVVRARQLCSWYTCAADVAHVQQCLQSLPAVAGKVTCLGTPALKDLIGDVGESQIECDEAPPFSEAAALQAHDVLIGSTLPLIELRRDRLAPAQRNRRISISSATAVIALITLLLTVTCALLWRAHRYAALTAHLQAQQRVLFGEFFPQSAPPTSVRSRLASEERRLRGVAGTAQLPSRMSSLQMLHHVLSRLPSDIRFRILELRLSAESVLVEGQARSHTDVDSIAAAMRRDVALLLNQPRTVRMADKGVSFTISGVYGSNSTAPGTQENP